MHYQINPAYQNLKDKILEVPKLFENQGQVIQEGRNLIKVIDLEGLRINVKSFKKPNIINRFAYRYLRDSKAKRSFLYATKLLHLGVSTPAPLAYIEFYEYGGLSRSYYISIQEDCDYTYRELLGRKIEEISNVLEEFTRFTYNFHKNGVYFIDHSPGNTLIKEQISGFKFFLVDLNRTKFKPVDLNLGIKNFHRLGANEAMVRVMAKEYARLRSADEDYVTAKMLKMTLQHNEAVRKRKAKKQKLKKGK
ncbi:MAG: hypothetical protein ACEPOZ_03295 [Marinifilaceae bacterium]